MSSIDTDANEFSEEALDTETTDDVVPVRRRRAALYWMEGLYGLWRDGGFREKRFLRAYALYAIMVYLLFACPAALWVDIFGRPLMDQIVLGLPVMHGVVALLCLFLWLALPTRPSRRRVAEWRDVIEETNERYRNAILHPDARKKRVEDAVDPDRLAALRSDMATAAPLSQDEARQLLRYRLRPDVLPPCIAFPADREWATGYRHLIPECILVVLALFGELVPPVAHGMIVLGIPDIYWIVIPVAVAILSLLFFVRARRWIRLRSMRGDQQTAQRMHEYCVRELLTECRFATQAVPQAKAKSEGAEPGETDGAPAVEEPMPPLSDDDLKYCIGLAQTGHEDAIARLRAAVKAGNAGAQFGLGTLLWRGIPDIGQDIPEAVRLLTMAAQNNHTEAMNSLGWIYHHGVGEVARDDARAIEWWEKAASQGDMTAQRKMALLYENGDGVPKDIEKAIEWYKKAGEQGDDKSLYNLGCIYFKGNGVPKNVETARGYFEQSDELGNELAHNMIKWMY